MSARTLQLRSPSTASAAATLLLGGRQIDLLLLGRGCGILT